MESDLDDKQLLVLGYLRGLLNTANILHDDDEKALNGKDSIMIDPPMTQFEENMQLFSLGIPQLQMRSCSIESVASDISDLEPIQSTDFTLPLNIIQSVYFYYNRFQSYLFLLGGSEECKDNSYNQVQIINLRNISDIEQKIEYPYTNYRLKPHLWHDKIDYDTYFYKPKSALSLRSSMITMAPLIQSTSPDSILGVVQESILGVVQEGEAIKPKTKSKKKPMTPIAIALPIDKEERKEDKKEEERETIIKVDSPSSPWSSQNSPYFDSSALIPFNALRNKPRSKSVSKLTKVQKKETKPKRIKEEEKKRKAKTTKKKAPETESMYTETWYTEGDPVASTLAETYTSPTLFTIKTTDPPPKLDIKKQNKNKKKTNIRKKALPKKPLPKKPLPKKPSPKKPLPNMKKKPLNKKKAVSMLKRHKAASSRNVRSVPINTKKKKEKKKKSDKKERNKANNKKKPINKRSGSALNVKSSIKPMKTLKTAPKNKKKPMIKRSGSALNVKSSIKQMKTLKTSPKNKTKNKKKPMIKRSGSALNVKSSLKTFKAVPHRKKKEKLNTKSSKMIRRHSEAVLGGLKGKKGNKKKEINIITGNKDFDRYSYGQCIMSISNGIHGSIPSWPWFNMKYKSEIKRKKDNIEFCKFKLFVRCAGIYTKDDEYTNENDLLLFNAASLNDTGRDIDCYFCKLPSFKQKIESPGIVYNGMDNLLSFGGYSYDEGRALKSIYSLNLNTKRTKFKWKRYGCMMNKPRYDVSVTQIINNKGRNKFIIMGGKGKSTKPIDVVEMFDSSKSTKQSKCNELTELNFKRFKPGSCQLNGNNRCKIAVAGGILYGKGVNRVEIYDLNKDKWIVHDTPLQFDHQHPSIWCEVKEINPNILYVAGNNISFGAKKGSLGFIEWTDLRTKKKQFNLLYDEPLAELFEFWNLRPNIWEPRSLIQFQL